MPSSLSCWSVSGGRCPAAQVGSVPLAQLWQGVLASAVRDEGAPCTTFSAHWDVFILEDNKVGGNSCLRKVDLLPSPWLEWPSLSGYEISSGRFLKGFIVGSIFHVSKSS